MIEERAESQIFGQLAHDLIENGIGFRFQAKGRSMLPTIGDGDMLRVKRVESAILRVGDIVLFKDSLGFKAHRVIRKRKSFFVMRGDAGLEADSTISGGQIVGKIVAKECAETGDSVVLEGVVPRLYYFSSQLRCAVSRKIRRWSLVAMRAHLLAFVPLLAIMLAVPGAAWGQLGGVALDNVNSQGFVTSSTACIGNQPATCTFTFNHTTNSVIGSTGLLVVGISMNIRNNSPDSSVTGLTYNGTAMTVAANANPGNNLRVQIFYLKNPSVGTFPVTATVNKTGGVGNQIGLEIAAMTVYRVNLSFTSLILVQNSGSALVATAPFTAGTGIPSTNDGVLDVVAIISGNFRQPSSHHNDEHQH